jgi:hypothetical protein
VTFRTDVFRSAAHAVVSEEPVLLDGKAVAGQDAPRAVAAAAAALGAARVKEQQHACTSCGRPFDHQEALVNPVTADADALESPGEEGTARGDVY